MCRTTWPLDPKRSDGRITYNSREKEDSLSLKIKFEELLDIFSFLLPHVFFSFVLILPFCCSLFSFSHFIFFSFLFLFLFAFFFHFLFSFGHSLSHFGRMVKRRKLRRKFPSHFLNPIVWLSFFHFYSISLYFLYDILLSCGSL